MNSKHSNELDLLFENRPSILRNTLGVVTARIFAWLLALISLSFGISLVLTDVQKEMLQSIFGISLSEDKNIQLLQGIGYFLIAMSLFLFFIVRLCKMIMERNAFVLELAIWHDDYKEAELKKEKTKASHTSKLSISN